MASVSYTGTPDDDGFVNSSRVVLTSRVNTPEDQRYLGGESTISLTVELASDLPYGEYRIVQWIPSNLRFRDAVTSERVWYELDGQLLTAVLPEGGLLILPLPIPSSAHTSDCTIPFM